MYRRILIPLDGSATAEKVLPYARLLARAFEVPAELIVVIDVAAMATHLSGEKLQHLHTWIAREEKIADAYLQGVAQSFPEIDIRWTVKRGRPEEVIVEKAAGDSSILIAMATHGRSGLNRWLLGSVAEKVLRATANPLLLVRAHESSPSDGEATLKTVIVPLDGSELAEAALPRAVELARALELETLLLRAYELPAAVYCGKEEHVPDYEQLKNQFRLKAVAYLEEKAAALKAEGAGRVSWITPEGSGPNEIIACAQQNPGSVVTMSTHGRSGIKRWILGSVTEKVVRHSGHPVLIVRAG